MQTGQRDMGNAHALAPIGRVRFDAADRMAAQDAAIRAAEADPAPFFVRFTALAQALGGRFIGAHAFKETFDAYRGSPAHRQRYNAPLHNICVALADAWLHRVLQQPRAPERGAVVFITGAPGVGKTAAVLAAVWGSDCPLPPPRSTSSNLSLPGIHAVYEGQLTKPESALPKIRDVLNAGFRPIIVALHPAPERALENTLQRFAVMGRGASIHNMARLQGNLPEGLAAIRAAFGDAVALHIIDRRDFDHPHLLAGWTHLPVLASEGNREHIRKRLEKHLDALRGQLSAAAWRQASGLPPE
jgi:hypothetical protein